MDYISFLSLYLWREPMNLISMAKQKDGFLGEQALVLPPAIVQRMKTDPATSILYITDIGYYQRLIITFGSGKLRLTSMCLSIVRRVGDGSVSMGRNTR